MILTATGRPVFRLRAGVAEDSYGDPVEDWEQPDRKRLVAAEVQEVSSEETEGVTRPLLEDERRLFARGRADVRADDRIDDGVAIWRVDGRPLVREGLAQTVYTTATLRRISDGKG